MPPDMNTILGLGQDIVFEGKTYRISDDIDFSVEADFERWLKQQAMQNAMDVCGNDPQEADNWRRIFFRDSVAGVYRFGGELASQVILSNFDASVKLLHLLLEDGRRKSVGKGSPDVDAKLAKRMLKDKQVGPWVQSMCLVALGLDPSTALIVANGQVATRAATAENQAKQATIEMLKDEIKSRQSDNSSVVSLEYTLSYLNSLGKN